MVFIFIPLAKIDSHILFRQVYIYRNPSYDSISITLAILNGSITTENSPLLSRREFMDQCHLRSLRYTKPRVGSSPGLLPSVTGMERCRHEESGPHYGCRTEIGDSGAVDGPLRDKEANRFLATAFSYSTPDEQAHWPRKKNSRNYSQLFS